MRRIPSSLLALAVLAAALAPGAAVLAQSAAPGPCDPLDPANPRPLVEAVDVIVIAEVRVENGTIELLPEAVLKGPPSSRPIAIDPAPPRCEPGALADGSRVLVLLDTAPNGERAARPPVGRAWTLADGIATAGEVQLTGSELVENIRRVTGQYAVPASGSDDDAGIDFSTTILPIAGVSALLLVVGLALMRLWHKIDPS